MTADQINELRAAYNAVGRITLLPHSNLSCEGAMKMRLSESEALAQIESVWNDLDALFDEVAQLAEDHARMTHTLRAINDNVLDAMQGTARSQIVEDWWQVREAVD